ncbi:PAS domain S-box protein, partial [bacterium]|nr:PAS domain S-box protein [bacterium]
MSIKKMSYIIFSITFLVILTSILSLPFIFDSYKKAQAFEELLKNTSIALENTSSALNEYLVFSMPRAKTQLALAARYENHSLNKLEKFSSDYPLITTLVKKHKDFQKNLDILFNIMNSGKNHIISEKNKKLVVKEIGSQLFLLSSERSGYVMELSFLAKKNFMFKSNILIGSIFICIFILSGLLGLIVLWLQKRLVSPLVTLRDSVESIAQGNFTIKPTIQRNDEIGSLADSFSVMQKSIQKNIIKITEAREDLHITLNSIGDGVISTDMQGRVARMNPVAEKLTGWTYKKAKGKQVSNVFNIIHTQTGELADNPVEKVLATGKVVGLANHTALIAKNGSKYQIADSGAPIRNTKGNITGVVLVFRNVTKEYQLREQYITLFEKTNDAIFIVEKSTGRYLDANAAAAQLTGRTLKELKQLTTHDVAPESSDKRFFDIADSDKTREYGTITYCQPDNTRRIARLSTVPLNDNAVIDIAKDITHDLEVEKQLLQSQKMEAIGTLAGGIAHD